MSDAIKALTGMVLAFGEGVSADDSAKANALAVAYAVIDADLKSQIPGRAEQELLAEQCFALEGEHVAVTLASGEVNIGEMYLPDSAAFYLAASDGTLGAYHLDDVVSVVPSTISKLLAKYTDHRVFVTFNDGTAAEGMLTRDILADDNQYRLILRRGEGLPISLVADDIVGISRCEK